jgi:hypothetical protein
VCVSVQCMILQTMQNDLGIIEHIFYLVMSLFIYLFIFFDKYTINFIAYENFYNK